MSAKKKILANSEREAKYYTRKNTAEIEELTDNPLPRELYEAVVKWIGSVRYDLFGTITFRYGGFSRDSLQGVARRLKKQIQGKIKNARITFVFEEHRLTGTYERRYHIHFLVEPTGLSLEVFKTRLNPILRRISNDGLRSIGVGKTDLREIYDQADLIDYLTKPLRWGDCRMLDIDYENSDLRKYSEV